MGLDATIPALYWGLKYVEPTAVILSDMATLELSKAKWGWLLKPAIVGEIVISWPTPRFVVQLNCLERTVKEFIAGMLFSLASNPWAFTSFCYGVDDW